MQSRDDLHLRTRYTHTQEPTAAPHQVLFACTHNCIAARRVSLRECGYAGELLHNNIMEFWPILREFGTFTSLRFPFCSFCGESGNAALCHSLLRHPGVMRERERALLQLMHSFSIDVAQFGGVFTTHTRARAAGRDEAIIFRQCVCAFERG
jgi:hypothetical protein